MWKIDATAADPLARAEAALAIADAALQSISRPKGGDIITKALQQRDDKIEFLEPGKTGKPAEPVPPAQTKVEIKPASISLSLNIDGSQLAQTMTQLMLGPYQFPTTAPAFDGAGSFVDGDHNHPDN
jgi:hypothetical protein